MDHGRSRGRDWYPAVSGASVDDDDDESSDDDSDDEAGVPTAPVFTAEQQTVINRLIGDARKDARTKAEADASAKAEKDRLAAENKFKDLYESSDKELNEIKPKYEAAAETITGLEEAVATYINPQIDKLPKITQRLIKEQPILKQLEILAEAGDEAEAEDTKPDKPKQRVPPSNTGRREKKDQPLAFEHTQRRQSRVINNLKERVGGNT